MSAYKEPFCRSNGCAESAESTHAKYINKLKEILELYFSDESIGKEKYENKSYSLHKEKGTWPDEKEGTNLTALRLHDKVRT